MLTGGNMSSFRKGYIDLIIHFTLMQRVQEATREAADVEVEKFHSQKELVLEAFKKN